MVNGRVSKEWLQWFTKLKNVDDTIKKHPAIVFTGVGATLDTNHLGKVVHFENGSTDVIVTLPNVTDAELYSWVEIYRLGTGKLKIKAYGTGVVERTTPGNYIWCDEEKRVAANLKLTLIRTTPYHIWGITGGTGIWKMA